MAFEAATLTPALFPEIAESESTLVKTGILPSQNIRSLIQSGYIHAHPEIREEQIQPASLDLRLGELAHRIQASFLPGESTVEAKIREFRMSRVDLTRA